MQMSTFQKRIKFSTFPAKRIALQCMLSASSPIALSRLRIIYPRHDNGLSSGMFHRVVWYKLSDVSRCLLPPSSGRSVSLARLTD
jgi:hypothetical protein